MNGVVLVISYFLVYGILILIQHTFMLSSYKLETRVMMCNFNSKLVVYTKMNKISCLLHL